MTERLAKQAGHLTSLMEEFKSNNEHRLSLASALSGSKYSPKRGSRDSRQLRGWEVDEAVKGLKAELKAVKKKCVAQVQESLSLVDELAKKEKIEEDLRQALQVERTLSEERLADLRELQYKQTTAHHRENPTDNRKLEEHNTKLLAELTKLQHEFAEVVEAKATHAKALENALTMSKKTSEERLSNLRRLQQQLAAQREHAGSKLQAAAETHDQLRAAAEERDKKRLADIGTLRGELERARGEIERAKDETKKARGEVEKAKDEVRREKGGAQSVREELGKAKEEVKKLEEEDRVLRLQAEVKGLTDARHEEQLERARAEQHLKLANMQLEELLNTAHGHNGHVVTLQSFVDRAEKAEGEVAALREVQQETVFHAEQTDMAYKRTLDRVGVLEDTIEGLKAHAVDGKRVSLSYQSDLTVKEREVVQLLQDLNVHTEELSRAEAILERERIMNCTLKEDKTRLLADVHTLATEAAHLNTASHHQCAKIATLQAENTRLTTVVKQFQDWASGVVRTENRPDE